MYSSYKIFIKMKDVIKIAKIYKFGIKRSKKCSKNKLECKCMFCSISKLICTMMLRINKVVMDY